MKRAPLALLLACGLHLAVTGPARADSPQHAEELFREALALMKTDDCPRAIPQFLKSQELEPDTTTLLNLATCYARIGRTGSAWRTYRQAADSAAAEKNAVLAEKASQALEILGPRLTRLNIVVAPSAAPVTLALNGQIVPTFGEPVPVDPGENIVEASAPGRQPWRHSVNVTEAAVTLVVAVPELPLVPSKPDDRSDLRLAGIVVGGAGVAGVIVGSIFGLSAKASADEMSGNCRDGYCNGAGIDAHDSAVRKARLSTYTLGFGAILAVSGLTLFLSAAPRHEPRVGVALSVPATGSPLGLSIRGRL